MALHQLEPHRPGPRRDRRGANLVEQPRDPHKNGPNDGGSAQRSGRIRWAEILTRYELWDDLIAATTSGALDWSDIPIEQEQKAYTLGQAYAAKNDQASSPSRSQVLNKLIQRRSQGRAGGAGGLPASGQGRDRPGLRPVRQGHLDAARGAGPRPPGGRNFGFAESIARQAVDKNPNQVPPLAALVEILHAVGKDKDAREAYRSSSHWPAGPTATCRSSAGSSRSSPAGRPTRPGRAQPRAGQRLRHRRDHRSTGST